MIYYTYILYTLLIKGCMHSKTSKWIIIIMQRMCKYTYNSTNVTDSFESHLHNIYHTGQVAIYYDNHKALQIINSISSLDCLFLPGALSASPLTDCQF